MHFCDRVKNLNILRHNYKKKTNDSSNAKQKNRPLH